MPCDSGMGRGCVEYQDTPETIKKLDQVTRLLCAMCKKHGVGGVAELADWYAVHKKIDEARERMEAAQKERNRQSAIAAQRRRELVRSAERKLTPDERAAIKGEL